MSALQLNWTQEPHLVPKHNLFGLRRVMMLDELECAIDTLNLAPPSKPKICAQDTRRPRGHWPRSLREDQLFNQYFSAYTNGDLLVKSYLWKKMFYRTVPRFAPSEFVIRRARISA